MHFPLLILLIFSGCGQSNPGSVLAPADPLLATYPSINSHILTPKCIQCHNTSNASGGVNLSDYTNVLNSLSPGNASISKLYNSVNPVNSTNSANPVTIMPPSGPTLSNPEINAIRDWINNFAPASGTNQAPDPNPTATPTKGSNSNAKFTYISNSILQPKCIQCHSSYSTYSGLIGSGDVIAKDGNNSLLFKRVLDGSMPKGSTPLSNTDITAIYDWINAGADNN